MNQKKKKLYKGYSEEDFRMPYALFYQDSIESPSEEILEASNKSPFPSQQFIPFEQVAALANPGYGVLENGFAIFPDNSVAVSVLTPMPRVSPQMWDWWFGWHGCEDSRYKLWHPKAHLSAQWADGSYEVAYINRTSIISEYLGKYLEKAWIQFCSPETLGLPKRVGDHPEEQVFICARVGLAKQPVNIGWLVHQVRSTANGAEMRSRFWIGGKFIEARKGVFAGGLLSLLLRSLLRPSKQRINALFLHCSEEMKHLATFLPELYSQFK